MPAELIYKDKRYASTIENLSEDGAYIITAPQQSSFDFTPDTPLELRFQFPDGEKLVLYGKVKWSFLTPPHGFTNSIGVEIINPPLTYKEAFNRLI